MTTFPCPWCDEAVVLAAESWLRGEVRCDACTTWVALAADEVTHTIEQPSLALAA